jgi:hypothetical protein
MFGSSIILERVMCSKVYTSVQSSLITDTRLFKRSDGPQSGKYSPDVRGFVAGTAINAARNARIRWKSRVIA